MIFEQAAQKKLRFPYKGFCSAEDLFDLSLPQLDGIFKTLNKERQGMEQESLLDAKDKDTTTLDLQIAVIRRVVEIKITERDENKARTDRAAKKQRLLEILSRKQDAELEGKSPEELQEMLADLSA